MKLSPIQLLETNFDRIAIEPNAKYEETETTRSQFESVELQFHQEILPAPEYWDSQAEDPKDRRDRTYQVRIGVRTDPEDTKGAYVFEVVCSGIFMSQVDRVGKDYPADEACADYGYAILFGIVREQISQLTSRMRYGARMLPTMSFMGDGRSQKTASAQQLTDAQKQVLPNTPTGEDASLDDTTSRSGDVH